MFASLRFRVLLLVSVLIAAMAVYVIVRAGDQRRLAIDQLRAEIHGYAALAIHRQEEVIANGRLALEAVASTPEIRRPFSIACNAELAKLLRMRPRYLRISILDRTGTVNCSAVSPSHYSLELGDRVSFRRAFETGEFSVGEYQIDRGSKTPFLDLAFPILDNADNVGAVVVVAVDLSWLIDSIGSRLLPAGSAVDFIRTDGTLVARYPALPDQTGRDLAGTELYAALESPGIGGRSDVVGLDGVRRIYEVFELWAKPTVSAGYTVVGIPVTTAVEAINRQLRLELIDLAVVGLVLLLGGYIVGEIFVARPIGTLVAMSRRIGGGERGIRSGLSPGAGEFGTLAASMDRMAAAIEDYENQIIWRGQQLADSQEFARLFSWRWTLDDDTIETSESVASILGVSLESWDQSSKNLLNFVHPDDRDKIRAVIGHAIESKETYFIEYRAIRQDGDVREFWERGRCELDSTGKVVAVVGIVQDITPLKEAERARQRAVDALRESEEKFRSAIEVSPVGMALLAPDGAWVIVNDVLCRVTGYTARELLATSLQAVTHPGDGHGESDPILQARLYEGDNYQAERRLVHKDGHIVCVLVSASLVRESGGAPRYFILQMQDISERKAAETALKASEERYRRLLQVIPDAVTVTRGDQLAFVNDAAVQLFGAERAHDILGRSLFDFISPDCQIFMRERIRRLQEAERKSPLVELQATRMDGTLLDVEATGCSFSDGNERSVVTILRDITLRKRGEEALRESEEQLRLIADSLPIMLARVDRDARYLFLNAEAERRCGVGRGEMLGRSVREVLGEDEYAKVGPYLDLALAGQRVTFSTSLSFPNGSTRDIEATYIPDLAQDHSVRGVFMVSLDVTDSKQAEAASHETERRFRHLVETANAVPYTWDIVARRYTYLGPQAESLFGHPSAMLADRSFWLEQVHADDREEILKHWERFEANPRNAQLVYRIQARNGKVLWINDTVTVGTGANGLRVGYGIMIDVTENKLRDRQIGQAQKMEALGHMTGGVAHDFNNLLTVIVVNLELVASRLKDASHQHRIAQAIQAASNGIELARRMLAFGRRQVLRPSVVNPNELVGEFLPMIGRTINESIDVQTDFAADAWPVRVDRSALEAAILNLTVNARDAMPAGGTLTITTANVIFDERSVNKPPELKVGSYVMLAVGDTGTGMSPETLARAFEPFFTTKEVGKGTGLGLSMVYGFVKQSGGFIYIDSEIGRGTWVRVYLPRAEAAEVQPPANLSRPTFLPSGRETILVVEDDAAVRTAATSLLESLGYCVLQAHDGPSALKVVEEHVEIDLLLTDVVMPGGMKGPDLAQRVLELRPHVKLVYMTGYADHAGFRDGAFEPFAEVIGKPFHSEDLASKVREVLDRRKLPRRKPARRNSRRA